MRNNKKDSRLYTDWMEFAENDLIAAKKLADNNRTLLLSAFCSHQAIEKSLKAFSLYKKGYAPDGHNIIFLCKKAIRDDSRFGDLIDECIELNNYYVSTRYPPDFPHVMNKERAIHLYNTAKTVYSDVLKILLEQMSEV